MSSERVLRIDRPALEFSVLITSYFEEASIDEFHARLTKTMQATTRSFEIVMVNDGSTDDTFNKLCAIQERDSHVSVVIDLFRNSGQTAAMTAAINHAAGEHFIFLDSDLQLDPEEVPLLLEQFDRGYSIVSGCRKNRKDSFLRTWPSKFANMMMRRAARHPLTDFGCTFKVIDGRLIRAFEFGPTNVINPIFVFSRAGKCTEVPVTHHPRKYGHSGWTFMKLFGYYMETLVGYSTHPFQLLSFICAFVAVISSFRVFVSLFVDFSLLPTITPGLLLNAIFISLLLLMAVLAAVGEYSIRCYSRLLVYPAYVIRETRQQISSKARLPTPHLRTNPDPKFAARFVQDE